MQQRADIPPPPPLRRGLIDLPNVLESEDVLHERTIPKEWVERSENPHPSVRGRERTTTKSGRCEIRSWGAFDPPLFQPPFVEELLRDSRSSRVRQHRPCRPASA